MAYQCVMRLLRFARNDNNGVMQRFQFISGAPHMNDMICFGIAVDQLDAIILTGDPTTVNNSFVISV